jgi:hypothetical protein
MSIVLPFAEKFVVEEVTRDVLFPRSVITTGTCMFSRNPSSRFDFGVMASSMKIQKEYEWLPKS